MINIIDYLKLLIDKKNLNHFKFPLAVLIIYIKY